MMICATLHHTTTWAGVILLMANALRRPDGMLPQMCQLCNVEPKIFVFHNDKKDYIFVEIYPSILTTKFWIALSSLLLVWMCWRR